MTNIEQLWSNLKYPPNHNQKKAVFYTDGPLLIIAGPGSGKSFTLVERIVYLIIDKGVKPEEIFVSTFTEKAAKELITRVSNRLIELDIKVNLNEMYIGTLHSIFLRLLEEYRDYTRLKRSYRVLDSFDQQFLVYRNLNKYFEVEEAELVLGPKKAGWYQADTLIGYINKVGEECLDLKSLKKSEDGEIRALGNFYDIYLKHTEEENVLDFSSIQTETLRLIENNSDVLHDIQERIKYFMIDEYQDTNTIQEKIILLLASEKNNLCVVGDDDQGLYRFRGATIRNILEFPQNFNPGECHEIKLETNYRSHPDIVRFYNQWMRSGSWTEGGITFRHDKTILPNKKDNHSSRVIKVRTDGSQEAYFHQILKFIHFLEDNNVLKDKNQIAFLFKSVKHNQVIDLAEFLEENGINVFSPRSALFFEREEIQLLIGALVFIFPNLFEILKWKKDAELSVWEYYKSCVNLFSREIKKDRLKHGPLLVFCNHLAKKHKDLTENTDSAFAAILYKLVEYPLFKELIEIDFDSKVTDQRPAYNIGIFSKLLTKFEYLYNVSVISPDRKEVILKSLFNNYFKFLLDGGITEFEDFDEQVPSGCVSFMTIHQSKGLEFPIVITGLPNNRQGPRKQFNNIDKILQEQYYLKEPYEPLERTKYYDFWRLYYTAFSRPQNLLVLIAKETYSKKNKLTCPHELFHEIYNEVPEWNTANLDVKNLVLDKISESNIKNQYSFTSHILLYENCPTQYQYFKELEFNQVRTGSVLGGIILHQTIEDIHKAVLNGKPESLTNEQIESWFTNNYHLASKQNRSYLHKPQLEAILKQVLNYRNRQEGNWHKIKEAEVDVSLVKEEFILKGTIDLIEGENNTVELVDFKSGKKPDVNDEDPVVQSVLSRYQRQLEVYAHLVEERTGNKVSKMHLYYAGEESSSPYVTFEKDESRIDQTINSFEKVVKKIESKNFDNSHIQKNEKQCKECDMRFYCNPGKYK